MLRRSPRLATLDRVCYKETPYRVFKKRQRCADSSARSNASTPSNIGMAPSMRGNLGTPPVPRAAPTRVGYLPLLFLAFLITGWSLYFWLSLFLQPNVALEERVTQLTMECRQMRDREERAATDQRHQPEALDTQERPVADRMPDFALESLGASVVCSSETYSRPSFTIFGIRFLFFSKSPRIVIQGDSVLRGRCWPFRGEQGGMVIALSHAVTITHVTLDHLNPANSPDGLIKSAPRDFEIYGCLADSEEGTLLGRFRFEEHGASTQTFPLPDPSGAVYSAVELRVVNNWGQEHTCLYRFRVHGEMATPK